MVINFITALALLFGPVSLLAFLLFLLPPYGKGNAKNCGCFFLQTLLCAAWLIARYCL